MSIALKLAEIKKQIRAAEMKYQHVEGSVQLLAVTKAQDIEKIVAAITAGQRIFGENYLQEALQKIKALRQYDLEWHFIGDIQANKTRAIAENFSWVQSVSRLKIAERLNKHRPLTMPTLNICIQINISEESTKKGANIDELPKLCAAINQFDRLCLRGLMVIPAPMRDFSQQVHVYGQVKAIQQDLIHRGYKLDTLSMGMSDDFEAAIAAGSTMVRIGRNIFGKRRSS